LPPVIDKQDYEKLSSIHFNLGKAKWKLGKNDEALAEFQYAISYSDKINRKLLELIFTAKIWGAMGVIYDCSGDFDTARKCYLSKSSATKLNK